MKKVILKAFIVSVVVFLLPFVLTLLLSSRNEAHTLSAMDFTIYYEVDGMQEKLSFDEYLLGVVAANMPAGYHMEALKAQAVIARTYALYNIALLLEDAPLKSEFTTSELGLYYISLENLNRLWGTSDYKSYFTRVENAVYVTKDEVLVYHNDLILPVFFDTGAGFTRSASEAWGIDISYLKSVESKQDVTSTNYLNIEEYYVAELLSLLSRYYQNLTLTEDNFFEEVTISSRDSANYVLKIDLGKLTVSGEEFAKVLGLPSNHFYIENYEGNVRIICNGAGHGVGLSQYGANYKAEEGMTYAEILKYYYSGVELISLKDN